MILMIITTIMILTYNIDDDEKMLMVIMMMIISNSGYQVQICHHQFRHGSYMNNYMITSGVKFQPCLEQHNAIELLTT